MKTLIALAIALILSCAADARMMHGGVAGPHTLLAPTTIFAVGDSNTTGQGVPSPSTQAYPALLGVDWSATPTNLGQPGGMACDNINFGVFHNLTGFFSTPSLTAGALYTLMLGTNDANVKGAGSYEAIYDLCQQASLAWMATPDTSIVKAQNCSQTGTWTSDSVPPGYGVRSSVNGSTLICTVNVTATGIIHVFYEIYDGDLGVASWAIPGGPSGSINFFTAVPVATQLGSNFAMALLRITGVSPGVRTVTFTVTSSTSASNPVPIWSLSSPPATYYGDKMASIIGGVFRQQSDAKAADTLAYNNDVAADEALLAGDGLPLYFADVRAYVNATTDMFDTLHINISGQSNTRTAIETAYH